MLFSEAHLQSLVVLFMRLLVWLAFGASLYSRYSLLATLRSKLLKADNSTRTRIKRSVKLVVGRVLIISIAHL